ncbi:kinase-like domain-containing protein [Phellopilus nigrolimitatus]|nr:kinase-like domain-containing protein [Phellopilus nigrolimitatus]
MSNSNADYTKYQFVREIGSGSFGCVWYCEQHLFDSKGRVRKINKVAVKCIKIKNPSQQAELEGEKKALHALQKNKHKNIVEILGDFDGVLWGAPHQCFVFEYATGGDLYKHLQEKRTYSEIYAAGIIRQILKGLEHLHSLNFIHRDIKPENILFKDQSKTSIVITDFGLTQKKKELNEDYNLAGTPLYMAPEIFDNVASYSIDIWAAGIIVYEMLLGRPPFELKSASHLLREIQAETGLRPGYADERVLQKLLNEKVFKVIKGKVRNLKIDYNNGQWNHLDKKAKTFVQRMLIKDPKARPSANRALADEWLNDSQPSPKRKEPTIRFDVGTHQKAYQVKKKKRREPPNEINKWLLKGIYWAAGLSSPEDVKKKSKEPEENRTTNKDILEDIFTDEERQRTGQSGSRHSERRDYVSGREQPRSSANRSGNKGTPTGRHTERPSSHTARTDPRQDNYYRPALSTVQEETLPPTYSRRDLPRESRDPRSRDYRASSGSRDPSGVRYVVAEPRASGRSRDSSDVRYVLAEPRR